MTVSDAPLRESLEFADTDALLRDDVRRLGAMVGSSVGVVTALTPFIGYAAAAALAKTALLTHRNVGDLVVEAGLMTREEVDKQLSPARLSGLEVITQAIPVAQPAENVVETG